MRAEQNMPTNALVPFARTRNIVLLPDNAQYTHRMEIKSRSSDNKYIVAMRKSDNTWCCSCPGWIGHRKCGHLTDMYPSLKAAVPQSKLSAPLVRKKLGYR